MGYDLHITRRGFWADENGSEISSEEWLALVEADQELERSVENGKYFARFLGDCRYGHGMGWFDWQDGCVSTKNPDEAILAKMLKLAKALDARVQGDDGEIYTNPDLDSGFREPEITADKKGVFNRFLGSLRNLVYKPTNRETLPFDVGDLVKDVVGNNGVVKEIDRNDDNGLGRITVAYDDGRILHWSISAHGLKKVSEDSL
jgi:hypothetical protein